MSDGSVPDDAHPTSPLPDSILEESDADLRPGEGQRRGRDDLRKGAACWFTGLVLDSQKHAKEQIAYVLSKARFWDTYADALDERQTKVLSRIFREGPNGFKGGMSAQKYAKMTYCSKATATRDLCELLKMGAIRKLEGGGRSTRYDSRLPVHG